MKFRLLVLRCTDLERSRLFYSALGLALCAEQHGGGPAHYACVLGDVMLELYPCGSQPATTGARLGFQVDVHAVVEAVRSAEVGELIRLDASNEAFLRDPDGNTVHLER